MDSKFANIVRTNYLEQLRQYFVNNNEDVQIIASGSLAFPVVVDGIEGWVEIDVKIPRWTDDDDGYLKAQSYLLAKREKEKSIKIKEEAKQRKISQDSKKREKTV